MEMKDYYDLKEKNTLLMKRLKLMTDKVFPELGGKSYTFFYALSNGNVKEENYAEHIETLRKETSSPLVWSLCKDIEILLGKAREEKKNL